MGETRRGYVVLIRGGDPEISGALARGALAGAGDDCRKATPSVAACAAPPSPEGKASEVADPARLEADRIADAWLDGQRLKRSVGNRKTAEDYALMTVKARGDYAFRRPGEIRARLWGLLGVLVLAADSFLAWEERCWRGGAGA